MYKKYNFQPKSLSPRHHFDISLFAEKLVPFLIIAAAFSFLWK